MSHVHPARVGNTQGTGIGGTQSLERLYLDHTMGRARQSDILQESLGNVIAGWAVQSYIGSYGPMSHPVGACATAAVSIEDGVDKILAGKADVIVAGGYDDIGGPGSLGFADMHATADSDLTSAMGLEPSQVSRANDVRRRGFVEAQGGGTMLLARADVAVEMGLPVLAVVGWAGSFGDGIHRSIPAPGMGVLSAAGGGATSPIGRALAPWGLTADDIAVVSKHDTSTAANDPNESDLHHRMQRALGRTPGNPLLVVSQKTVTGHAKGGAAAWQAIGLTQIMASGRIPGNRNLTCVDPKMRAFDTLVFNDAELEAPASQPLRAGLLTSLGFGHVNSLVLVIHPDALLAAISEDARETYIARRTARQDKASRTNLEVMLGQRARYTARTNRRFDAADGTKQQAEQEAEMLLNTSARLTPGAGAYRAPKA
jgi:fatty acid synthase